MNNENDNCTKEDEQAFSHGQNKSIDELEVAIVHDFLIYPGGAEKVLKNICELFPRAPIYTLLYDEGAMKGMFPEAEIKTSFLQRFPKVLRKRHRWLLPFYGTAVESFDLRNFDLVISSSGAWSKGIVTKLKTQHVAYIHSPMRFVWDYNERYWKQLRKKPSILQRGLLSYLRVWDKVAAERPDFLIANSQYTKRRIHKYYRQESVVIYPPASLPLVKQSIERKHFLVVSRLTEAKRIDIVVEAFNKLKLPLVIVGEGKERKRLEKLASSSVQFVGWKKDEDLANLYASARALIFASEDDFGIVIPEAFQQGAPVVALRAGGAKELIEEEKTGEFFESQHAEVLADGVRRFLENESKYDEAFIRETGNRYSQERFQKELRLFIEEKI